MEPISVKSVPWDHPDGICLRQAQCAEIAAMTGDDPPGIPPSSADVAIFMVAYRAGAAIGCGALRQLSPEVGGAEGSAEIKRMFVDAAYRGRSGTSPSVASLIYEALEKAALERGWTLLKLETGRFMGQARAFYEKCGFWECALFGAYVTSPTSVCYEKRLHLS